MMRVGSVPEKMSTGFLGTSPDDYRIRRSAALSSDSAQNKERNGNNMSLTSVNKLENNTVELLVQVSEEQFQDALMKAYKKKVKTIALPGFRKGKAPKAMIEKMYGKEFFYDDAINMVYPAAYEAAVEEAGIEPVDRANVSDLKVEQGNGFNFKATVTVKPDVTVKNYKGIKAEKTIETIMAADVNAELERMRERNSRLTNVERAAKNGDTALIDFEGFKDGVAFEGGKGENFPLNLGSGQFIPGFEEQLVGMEIGEDRDINLSFPEQYHAPELAGKAVVFKVKLHEIYNEKEAELNDEFAASLNFPEVQSVEDLKKYINEYLEYQVEARKADAAREKLYDQILESSSCLVSPQAVETAVNMQLQQMAASFAQQGVAMEQYLQMTGKTMDSLKDELKPVAQKQVKLEAVLDEIIRVENITVSDEELDEQYELISQKYGQPVDVVKQVLPKAQLKPDLLRMKASQLIIDAAEIIMEESGK